MPTPTPVPAGDAAATLNVALLTRYAKEVSQSSTAAEATELASRQRVAVAKLLAQAQCGAMRAGQAVVLVPQRWWHAWCLWVGNFSPQTDVAPCVRLLRGAAALSATKSGEGAAAFAAADWPPQAEVEKSYPLARVSGEQAAIIDGAVINGDVVEPGPLDSRVLYAPFEEHTAVEVNSGAWRLRADALESKDFEILPECAAKALASWHGRRGPLLRRHYVALPSIGGVDDEADEAEEATSLSRKQRRAAVQRFTIELWPHLQRFAAATVTPAPQPRLCHMCAKADSKACTRCRQRWYCSLECQRAHWSYHSTECKILSSVATSPQSSALVQSPLTPTTGFNGLVGLVNLGNTCFMNSSLQALSAAWPLTRYFLSPREWEADLNRRNPLGSGGRLARAYAALMRELWLSPTASAGGPRAVAPSEVKAAIGGFINRFSGFAQQDAQELLIFLLDCLHEDTNRVRDKAYVVAPDALPGQSDADAAAAAAAAHRARNVSHIDSIFGGQLKSTLVCPACERVAVKFDPFQTLCLPLSAAQAQVAVTVDAELRPGTRALATAGAAGARAWLVPVANRHNEATPAAELAAAALAPLAKRFTRHVFLLDEASNVGAARAALAGETGVPLHRWWLVLREPNGRRLILPDAVVLGDLSERFFGGRQQVSMCAAELCEDFLEPPPQIVSAAAGAASDDMPEIVAEAAATASVIDGTPAAAATATAAAAAGKPSRVLFLIRHIARAAENGGPESEAAALPSWEPATCPGGTAALLEHGASDEIEESWLALPAGATVAHLRYQAALALLPLIDTQAASDWLNARTAATAMSRNAPLPPEAEASVPSLPPPPPGALLRALARALPLAAVAAGAQESDKIDWLPSWTDNGDEDDATFTSTGTVSRRNARKLLACEAAPHVDSSDGSRVIRLRVFWRGAWARLLSPARAASVATTPVATRALREFARSREGGGQAAPPLLLEDVLDGFFAPETLDASNLYYCAGCKTHVPARKTLQVWSPPEVLVLLLKRFEISGARGRRAFGEKISRLVQAPLVGLDLTRFVLAPQAAPPVYDLVSVVCHFGSMLFGHYVAYANHDVGRAPDGAAAAPGQWRCFDDASVSAMEAADVISPAAYCLLYKRRRAA